MRPCLFWWEGIDHSGLCIIGLPCIHACNLYTVARVLIELCDESVTYSDSWWHVTQDASRMRDRDERLAGVPRLLATGPCKHKQWGRCSLAPSPGLATSTTLTIQFYKCCSVTLSQSTNKTKHRAHAREHERPPVYGVRLQPTFVFFSVFFNILIRVELLRVDEFNIDWWNHVILNPSQRTKSSFVLFNLVLFVQKLLTFYKVCLPWWYDFNFYEGKIIPLSRSLCQDSNYDNGAANYQLFDPCLKQYHRGLLRKIRLRLRMRCR